MERFLEHIKTKKVRIVDHVAKKDPGVSINDVLDVMNINEEVRFLRNEWIDSSVISTVARANTKARDRKEIEEYTFKYQSSNRVENDYVSVIRNI